MKTPPVRMLLLGAGFMGKSHLAAAAGLAAVRYTGVVDVDRNAARALAHGSGLRSYAGLEEALATEQPDAVDVCVPTLFHRGLIEVCAQYGVPVLCEKPLALTAAEARAIHRTVTRTGLRVMVAQVLRFWPEYVFAVQAARRGRFGQIRAVECQRLSPPPAWDSWMMRPDRGGGAVLDLQIHDMDFVLQLLGLPDGLRARGVVSGGAVNAVSNRLDYASGAWAEVQASYLMPPSYPFRMTFSVECEQGVMVMDSWRPKGQRLVIYPAQGRRYCPRLKMTNAYAAEIDYFARQLRASRPFDRVPLEESVAALQCCLASQTSCRTGRRVSLRSRFAATGSTQASTGAASAGSTE